MWPALIQFVAGAAQTHPAGMIHEDVQPTPWVGIIAGVGGVILLGGLAYMLLNDAPPRRGGR